MCEDVGHRASCDFRNRTFPRKCGSETMARDDGVRPRRNSIIVVGAALLCGSVSGTTVEGIGRGSGMARGKCYTVCPPVEYPTGHDPYYETPYFTLERELHGGPFGPGTLNPFNTNDVRNYLPRSAPQPFSEKLFTYSPPRNPYIPTFPNQHYS